MDVKEALSNTSMFRGLEEDELERILTSGKVVSYERSEIIFDEGRPARHFYVLLEGRVKIFKVSFGGKEQILHMVEPEEPFGEVPVFIGGSYPAYAMAVVKSSVFSLSKEAFLAVIGENPKIGIHIIGILCMRLRQFTRLVEELSLKEVPGRLATYLYHLYQKNGMSKSFVLDMPKAQLASVLGTVPETLSRAFSKLKGAGVIELNGSDVIVLDPTTLEEIAVEGFR
ncbi:MAG: Crp/Fnr family transcriptional regulator [Desulfatiglandales bacterium]